MKKIYLLLILLIIPLVNAEHVLVYPDYFDVNETETIYIYNADA